MASPGVVGFRRQNMAFGLAGALLLVGLLALLLITGGTPTARAAGPVLTVSTGTTNPGGDVIVSGTGWAPAKHYNLYVYAQSKCKPNPICPPPATAKPINAAPQPIKSNGSFGGFDFTFIPKAATITYVFTVVADYPPDAPYMASVPVKVVPAGTPPAGTPVSSVPTSTPTAATTVTASATATSQTAISPGTGTTTPTNSSGGNTLAIIVVIILLLIAIAVLIGLLIVLPPKRRAIRAAWYGAGGGTGGHTRYGASGPAAPGPRRTTGGYPPVGGQEPPGWMGGVAQWDEPPRGSGPRPRSPRRPPGGDY